MTVRATKRAIPRRRRVRSRASSWVTVACPSCRRALQLRKKDTEGRDLTPWTAPAGQGRLPCPFCIWDGHQTFYALELEPVEGEQRRCFWLGTKALDGTKPPRARRTTVPERVGCLQCRKLLARRTLDQLLKAAALHGAVGAAFAVTGGVVAVPGSTTKVQ